MFLKRTLRGLQKFTDKDSAFEDDIFANFTNKDYKFCIMISEMKSGHSSQSVWHRTRWCE